MRLNKTRLAAFAMSAVMTVSTMSCPVYAEELITDETPVAEEQTNQEAESVAYRVDPASILFNQNFSVTWTEVAQDGSGASYAESGTAAPLKQTEATCTEPAYLWMTITIDGTIYNSGNTDDPTTAFVTAPALGHNWEIRDDEGYVVTYPTCTEEGSGYYYQVCTRCGEKDDEAIQRVLEAEGHSYGENKIRYANLNNVELVNGEPQLVDPLQSGTYDEVTYHVCQRLNRRTNQLCGHEEVVSTVTRTIQAEKISKSEVTKQEGIATNLVGLLEDQVPAADKIELTNCTKDGKYQVTRFVKNAKDEWEAVSQRWVTVPAHHMVVSTVEFKNAEDKAQCTVDADTLKVTNHSCWKEITYYVVDHCTAAGCPNAHCDTEQYLCENTTLTQVNRTEKVAAPEGDHIINTEIENKVNAIKAKGEADYAELEALAAENAKYIKIRTTATCTEAGVTYVTFLCKVCKAEVKVIEVPTKALGHVPNDPVEENMQPATCQELGSYDAVVFCGRCGDELERHTYKIPRLAHTNEVSVSASGVGVDDTETDTTAYIRFYGNKVVDNDGESLERIGQTFGWKYGEYPKDEYKVWVEVYTNCTNCNDHEVRLDDYQDTTITVLDCQKQKESGEAGSITLQATYTKADGSKVTEVYSNIPYFSTMEAYQGRVEDLPLNGLNLDADGVYRYYVNGEFASDFVGIVEYGGERFFVTNGVLDSGANGLNLYEDEWYFLANGQIQRQHTGLAEYDGEWFYIVNGKLDNTVNGLVPYDGGTFLFAEGRLVREKNGLWQNFDGSWYYLALGQVQTQHTGVVEYDGAFFYVINGKLASDYTGTVLYDGVRFNVVAGQLYDPVA